MSGRLRVVCCFACMVLIAVGKSAMAEPKAAALSAFDRYVALVESRLEKQHHSQQGFLAPEDRQRLEKGEQIIEKLTPAEEADLPGSMLHHWRGTAFAQGATAADFERLMRDLPAYPRVYEPQVTSAKVLAHEGNHLQVNMRTRQKHVITVVMDLDLDVTFGQLDEAHRCSLSRSTKIAEIESPGTPKERALGPEENHGFLWRLNTYWSCEEGDGGLYMQIETVSLSRSVPAGLAWVIKPFVESVPRESLEFTLSSTSKALKK